MLTTKFTPKKLTFGKGNEVTGWFKSTNGEKIQFTITNDGEITQRGIDHKAHRLNTKADMTIDAIKNGQPSFAMIG